MLRPQKKSGLHQFALKHNGLTVLLLMGLFIFGLGLSYASGWTGILAYMALWLISYAVIYAGACRHCVYYGKKCPIPLEGSCVHRFFEKQPGGFGYISLFWAALAYGLRVAFPVYIIFKQTLISAGLSYAALLLAFWIVHLQYSGCPHCLNKACPLNPDYR